MLLIFSDRLLLLFFANVCVNHIGFLNFCRPFFPSRVANLVPLRAGYWGGAPNRNFCGRKRWDTEHEGNARVSGQRTARLFIFRVLRP